MVRLTTIAAACVLLASQAQAADPHLYHLNFDFAPAANVPTLAVNVPMEAEPGKPTVWERHENGEDVRIAITPAGSGDETSLSVSAKKVTSTRVVSGLTLPTSKEVTFSGSGHLPPNQTLVFAGGTVGDAAMYDGHPPQPAPTPAGSYRLSVTRVR